MSSATKLFTIIGVILLGAGVQLGALGAHALTESLSASELRVWSFAVQFQFYHALGLVLIGILLQLLGNKAPLKWAGWIMLAGIFLFSGSIYVTALGGPDAIGGVAPFGGALFMLAWILIAVAIFRA
jgi:uncharacterized membrane protein YgdD (TMEM256/DUF423 family)